MNQDDADSIEWFNPRNYRTRPGDIAEALARDIVLGASPRAAAAKYGVLHRFRDWMRWGADAAVADANPGDYHADYLDFYLKISQAMGIARVEAEQRLYVDHYQFWLMNHPETRGDWGGGGESAVVLIPAAATPETVVDAGASPVFDNDPTTLRTVMKMAVEAGLAVPQAIEGSTREEQPPQAEGTGT